MKKITYDQLWKNMNQFNKEHPEKQDSACLSGVIVYKASNWDKEYPELSRSYEVNNSSRAFQDGKISNRLSGYCLDGTDQGVRLDWYNWDIEYCYMK